MFISGFASGLSCFAGSTFFSGIMNNSIMFACIDQGCLFVIIRRVCRHSYFMMFILTKYPYYCAKLLTFYLSVVFLKSKTTHVIM